mmetsp:Transcript_34444/g.79637  ORF Transcript_34444/g.79637 Transcript_34444/m.79637 type:complete len:369 (-) Transcript_34444:310-1416(-)|eukprot:CAMPEP_0113326994 /NCGR_PEP_ID=MMETSP0010_2-20120614/18957_1 /TAXON_ID=216773 ORGANISM="Corethron hystrix, Strain 308" /NCGR_SAMPLE_ID=MMETSP0010_2 /ASSEMBLY_ACC=CAM_ASM_000155 /LENGTH=368 /DNA_ID=CAMNT_0000187641 /DNA_START=60 /DNA_END=1166 /DNA_ORIENTATION=+ /assembly_acc=CAM_ASM_000155
MNQRTNTTRRQKKFPFNVWTAAVLVFARESSSEVLCHRPHHAALVPRGGSDVTLTPDAEAAAALRRWRLNQRHLLHLRSTILAEVLASRGVPVASLPPSSADAESSAVTLTSVSTPEGSTRINAVDFDCAMSTENERRSCLYSFDAQVGTKVLAPIGTESWIGLSTLNRLRRTDPTKVEPMWHNRYGILSSWFADTEYSLLQYVGLRGWLVSTLLDAGNGMVLRGILLSALSACFVALGPAISAVLNRLATSGMFWASYPRWSRVIFGPLPLQLMVVQFLWKKAAEGFEGLVGVVREAVVDLECSILEDCIPVTTGTGVVDDYETDEESDDNNEEEEQFIEDEKDVDDDDSNVDFSDDTTSEWSDDYK